MTEGSADVGEEGGGTGRTTSRAPDRARSRLKTLTGYCSRWSVRAGDRISLMASSRDPGRAELSVVRIDCGDPTSAGPGFAEAEVEVGGNLPTSVDLTTQPLRPGSFGLVDLTGLAFDRRLEIALDLLLTRPHEPQTVLTLQGEAMILQIVVRDGRLRVEAGATDLALRPEPLANRRWYRVVVRCDRAQGRLTGRVTALPSASPGRDLLEPESVEVTSPLSIGPSPLHSLLIGGVGDTVQPVAGATGRIRGDLDGRIAAPSLSVDGNPMAWDLGQDMQGRSMVDVAGGHRHGVLHQLPARAVTGPGWDGSHQRWTDDPSQWNAVHFHKDDLYDAGWQTTAEVQLPGDLPSGIYAFRLRRALGEAGDGDDETGREPEIDRVPFFVRPAAGATTADVALLMPTATYLAYANHRMLFEGADFIAGRQRLRPEHQYVKDHPELGRSMYEKHLDGSGMMFSSRLRPVLNLRPGADGWNFTPDTDIHAFLGHIGDRHGVAHDVIADEDVHAEGLDALAPYRVLVTGSHPEYWSTAMLDALEAWQRNGGRLLYLGGNGFYWRVAFSDAWPGAMELRRAEDGVRNWQTEAGENYHAFDGHYGGMWRRNGRAPNELVGVGFAAQGFERAVPYVVNPDSLDPSHADGRAAWIWEGVEIVDDRIGSSGLGGGAAGQEVDRYDTRLGSPPHAVVLASATEFGPDMVRTKEEFDGTVIYPTPDPYVRADIVFYETPNGGAVFSVGSISWFGALARNGFDNDVATMTANVVRRFADPAPFGPVPFPTRHVTTGGPS